MKLISKIGLIFGIGAVAMIVATSFLIFTLTQSTLQKNIGDHQMAAAVEMVDKIDRILNNYFLTIKTIGEEEDFERFLSGEIDIQPEIDRRINELTLLTGPWDILFVVDRNGTIITSSDTYEIGNAISQEPLSRVAYEKALQGDAYYSDIVLSEDTGKPTVIFAVPIKEEAGVRPVKGVVIGNVSWLAISEVLQTSDLSGELDLYDKNGVLIATSQATTADLFVKNSDVRDEIGRSLAKHPVPFTELQWLEGDNEQYLTSYAPSLGFLSYRGSQWFLLVKTPAHIAFESAKGIALRMTAFMLLIIIVAIGFILFLLIKIFVRPIISLTSTATSITQGDLDNRIAVSSDDEIGMLGKTFNTMADTLVKDRRMISASAAQLRKELDKIEALMESIGDGVVAIDREWNIILWNKTATAISGWAREDALGKPFREVIKFIRERDREENIMFIEEAMLRNKPFSMEGDTVLIRKDGSETSISDSAAPIVGDNGKVTGVIIIFRDVSRERESQRLRSDFAYASHQIRTPVAKALWILEAAMDKENIQDIKERIRGAYQAIQSVNKLSEELIEVSRIDQKQISVEKINTLFKDVLADLIESMSIKANHKQVVLKTTVIPESALIKTSVSLLKKILQAIIENAIVYSKENSTVDVIAKIDNGELLVKVSNVGGGILDEDQPLVFTKFFRGKNINTTSIAGAGLGLYIAREYAKILGGKIWFESKGDAVTFYVSLPIA